MAQIGHVLVVDDDPVIRQLMQRSLEAQGCTITVTGTAREAVAAALAQPPDLILLDVMLPDLDGIELCRRVRAEVQLAEVPVIMITSLNDPDARMRSLEVGADDFITKPIDFIELRARVGSILRLNRYRLLLQERTQRQRAEEEMARRNRELSLLNGFIVTSAARLQTSLQMEGAVHHACTVLAQALGLAAAEAWLLPDDGAELLFTSSLSLAPPSAQPVASAILSYERAQQLVAAYGAMPSALDSALAEPMRWPNSQHEPMPHAVPIMLNGRASGAIVLLAESERRFDAQDRAFAQSLVSALGQAIETALLNRRLQRHAEQMEEMVAVRTNELQAERDRTQAILEALGEAVFVTDEDCIINYANPATTILTGYSGEELIGRSWCLLQHDESARLLYQTIHRHVRAGKMWRGELLDSRRDGSTYDAALTVAPIFDPQRPDTPAGVVSVHRDITPLKAAERTKDLFISNVSHELRTPLSIIALHSGNLDTLYDRLGEERRRHLIREVRAQAQLLDDLISDILDLSRIDSGGLLSEDRRIDLGEILSQAVAQLRPLASSKGLRMEVQAEQNLILSGDPAQLGQCVRNLISNAIKFTAGEGVIRCECRRLDVGPPSPGWPGYSAADTGFWAGLRIVDTGIGIDAKHIGNLFERFYRVQSQTHVPGTGLGLAITRELITRHGGWTGVASTPGSGSTFAFYLPLIDER
ncbi:response regulator [Oscillochloris sp. ZM17-4]|uniref:response regulator n=1 Tax=Oscillochloris sp. ZM17-4 TaxID=2866714 RepID=UPI001C732B62|nr:response regulator [Oscillochloris sp. ZM17-4]MBX0330567.1 response regulator [Oscillochloris sp. ZM17-4]